MDAPQERLGLVVDREILGRVGGGGTMRYERMIELLDDLQLLRVVERADLGLVEPAQHRGIHRGAKRLHERRGADVLEAADQGRPVAHVLDKEPVAEHAVLGEDVRQRAADELDHLPLVETGALLDDFLEGLALDQQHHAGPALGVVVGDQRGRARLVPQGAGDAEEAFLERPHRAA
jgi:hypothetical protein